MLSITRFIFIISSLFMLNGCSEYSDQASSSNKPTTPAVPDNVPSQPTPNAQLAQGQSVQVPYILWGGDMATFYGNGGLATTVGSVMDQQGLVVELVPGDNFEDQLAAYRSGASPFLRGTFRMIGLAADEFAGDPNLMPMVFMQMTWSAGDHLVGRAEIRTMDDLRGKTIAIQRDGPHIGMLDDVLRTARLSWSDVTVVWADNITGPNSPPELFRSNPAIDAAFAITPDMIGLTGGLESNGSGAEGTVKDARVVVSTSELSRSIADVYAVRPDYWRDHSDIVKKFTAAYLQSVEEVIELKHAYEASGSDDYMALLQMSQNIWGADVIPTLEEDAHGLLSDCTFVGHPGNVAFFTDPDNQHGFADFDARSQQLAVDQGYATTASPLTVSAIPWNDSSITAKLNKTDVQAGDRFNAEAVLDEIENMDADGVLDSRTLLSFTISFQPNQTEFDARQYESEYRRVFELADRFGNAAVIIRGHSDTTLVLRDAVRAGLESGKLRRSGTPGNYTYYLDGRPIDLEDPRQMAEMIQNSDAFTDRGEFTPRKTMAAALNLSRERADAVRASLLQYANQNGLSVDQSQVQSQGVGIREPLVARPRNQDEAAHNMRVEFRLVRVSAEAMTASDFDF